MAVLGRLSVRRPYVCANGLLWIKADSEVPFAHTYGRTSPIQGMDNCAGRGGGVGVGVGVPGAGRAIETRGKSG
jgi:hypothetical protein